MSGAGDEIGRARLAALEQLLDVYETTAADQARKLEAALTHMRDQADQLAHLAMHDELTDLPNRALLLDRLQQAIARRARHGGEIAVLFVDVDRFKRVNDSLGHSVGDELLVAVAERLRGAVRPADTVARFGGDEFVVLCDELSGDGQPGEISARIAEALARPVELQGHTVNVTASIGIAFVPRKGASAEEVLLNADAAMYRAKELGRDRTELFGAEMRSKALGRLRAEEALRQAIADEAFPVHYQPIVDLKTGVIWGVEALARWEDGEGAVRSPADFIPLAEETGLILPIGQLVLGEACRAVSEWGRTNPAFPPLKVAVNVSTRQLDASVLVESVGCALVSSGLDPALLCLEITESTLMHDVGSARSVLDQLRALGVSLAVDDFGTGYSSLSYLRQFPVDRLKIDRAFVAGIAERSQDAALVAGIVGLARALGLATTAEGIETGGQLAQLAEMGCDHGQGFYWSPPVPEEELRRWLDDYWSGRDVPEPIGPCRVLLVDDEPSVRHALRLALEVEGGFVVVAEAGDGVQAVQMARYHKPDLVVLDLMLPGTTGLQVLPGILEEAPSAKVAIVTARDLADVAAEDTAGTTALLQKGAGFDRLADQLSTLVRLPRGGGADVTPLTPPA